MVRVRRLELRDFRNYERAEVEADDGSHRLDVGFEPGEAKRFRIDDAQVDRPAAATVRPLLGVFMPDRLDLIKGAPALRRAHLDQVVHALWPARAAARAEYSRALAQRNALVARIRSGAAGRELLDPWDIELARHGIAVMDARRAALCELQEPFARLAAELGLPGNSALEYRARSRAEDADGLRAELAERRDDD